MADKQHVTTLDLPLIGLAANHPPAQRSRTLAWWGVITLFVASALVGRVCYVTNPFDSDGAMFIYLGKLVADGGRYGQDIIDNKFPTVGLMTSVAWRAFGHNWLAYVLLQTAMAVSGALLLARSAGRHFGAEAKLPTALFALVYLNMNLTVAGGFQLETLQAFFAILAAGAALEALHGGDWRDAFTVGLASGCAMMLKPTGGGVLAAFALTVCLTQPRRVVGAGLAAAGGLAIPAIGVLAYLIQTSTLAEMPTLARQISQYASATPLAAEDLLKPAAVALLLAFPMIVRSLIFRRERDVAAASATRAALVFAVGWLVMEAIGAVAQRRMYPYHFFILAAPAALLYGMLPRRDRLTPIVAALLPALLLSLARSGIVIAGYYPAPATAPASDYLRQHAAHGDRVWQDNMPRLLLETDLQPGARVPLAFLFFNHDTAPLEFADVILRDFESRQPKYVLLPTDLEAMLAFETARTPAERRPVRARNYREAWLRIESYVHLNYIPQAAAGSDTVFVRQPRTCQFCN